MPHSEKGTTQGNRKPKKNLHQPRMKREIGQQSMEASMKEKDGLINELQATLTLRDDKLKKFREVVLDLNDVIIKNPNHEF